ncbi:ABC transporter permease [Cellulomonas alba]|uniref:ABC transporter permease n=1 Tax=Cellulomonas alba TaxID=3053467 RepID=A0ABT7SFU4_9CELL|nr:ABC transporter permease [Cellulomonas alba]MDM7855057.1 ABC transporter permease [Cellulomonas alba]
MTATRDELVAAARGPRRFGWWYIAEHQFRQMRRYLWVVVVNTIGSPLLYLLGIGFGLASFMTRPIADGPDGPVSYLLFVTPALVASAGVAVASDEFQYSVMMGFKWRRLFWGMNDSPVEPPQIVTGFVLAVAGRMLFSTLAFAAIAVLFGGLGDPWSAFAVAGAGLLGGMAFGLPLLAYSATITEDKGQFALVNRFVFTPMFLFSGTFYPLATLPVWLQWIGWVSPLWHASEIGRAASYGRSPGSWPVGWHVVVLLTLCVAGWVAARRVFVRRLRG